MKANKFALLLCLLATLLATGTFAAELTVIELRNRTAEEILPVLRPLAGQQVGLSGVDYKLIVRGTPEEIAKIREVLAVLDRAPRQLLISVRYGGAPQKKTSDVGANANIGNGGAQVSVHGNVSTSSASDSAVSSIRVLEGNSAHISTGQSVPVVTAFLPTQYNKRTTSIGIATDYRELESGFNVLPLLSGDRVLLDIATQQQRMNDGNAGTTNTQRVNTTVAGKLGEWIELGSVTATGTEQRSSVATVGAERRISTQSDTRTVSVKVEQVQ